MNYKKQLTIPLMILSLSTLSFGTVYFDGEDGTVGNWEVHDNKPAGAVIENIIDDIKNSKVIEFKGDARRNSYMLGSRDWNNRTEKYLKWSMKFSEKFKITVYIKTKKGVRTLFYVYKNKDKGLYQKRYIKFGLGSKSMNGKWQNYSRDIEADLKKYEPDNELVKIKGMKVQGSGRMDDVRLEKKGDDSCITRKNLEIKIKNNEDVTKVNTSCIKDMSKLFVYNKDFNQDISNWDVSNVTNMGSMFDSATSFNQDISNWDVSHVTMMRGMFYETGFNQDISSWDVSSVTNMNSMFSKTSSFNQDISNWDVSNVLNMTYMFRDAKAFTNHDLSQWNVKKVKNHGDFFSNVGENNVEPKWNSSPIPKNAILKKAKESCLGKDKSTKHVLCSNEENIVYIVDTKKIDNRTGNNNIYRVSIEKNRESVEVISANIKTVLVNDYIYLIKLKNTPIYLKEITRDDGDMLTDWSFMYKGKELFTQNSNDREKRLYDIHTDAQGKKLIFSYEQGNEEPYGFYTLTYDISNPNKMVLRDSSVKALR